MRQIKVEALTHEAFAPFGSFYSMEQPDGFALQGAIHQFYPDRMVADSNHRVGYSPLVVQKPEKMIITQQEYHTTTWEMILPLNDDMILHCAPASGGVPATDYAKAFIVPKNTLVKLNAAICQLIRMVRAKSYCGNSVVTMERLSASRDTGVQPQRERHKRTSKIRVFTVHLPFPRSRPGKYR